MTLFCTLGFVAPLIPALIIAASMAATQAALAAAAARRQNKNIERAAESQRRVTEIENKQLAAQSGQAKNVRSQESARIRALSIVQAASRGISVESGSARAFEQQALIDEAKNRSTIDTNLRYGTDRNTSIFQANAESLRAQARNVGMDTLLGGLQGLQTGLSIGSSFGGMMGGASSAVNTAYAGSAYEPTAVPGVNPDRYGYA